MAPLSPGPGRSRPAVEFSRLQPIGWYTAHSLHSARWLAVVPRWVLSSDSPLAAFSPAAGSGTPLGTLKWPRPITDSRFSWWSQYDCYSGIGARDVMFRAKGRREPGFQAGLAAAGSAVGSEFAAEGMFGRVLLAFTYAGSPFSRASLGQEEEQGIGQQMRLSVTRASHHRSQGTGPEPATS